MISGEFKALSRRSSDLERLRARLLSRTALCGVLSIGILFGAHARPAKADPRGTKVVHGKISVQKNGNHTQFNQRSGTAILNHSSFDIRTNESVHFQQPGANALAVNRVVGSDLSTSIAGKLSATGNVWVLNPSGVAISNTARINVNGLLATTAKISDRDILAGRATGNYTFSGAADGTAITNAGSIAAGDGHVVLVAPIVENSGTITTKGSDIALGAGSGFTVDIGLDGLTRFEVQEGSDVSLTNSGALGAEGGAIYLTAAEANAVESAVVSIGGEVEATRIENRGGQIVISGGKNGVTEVSGTINASQATGNGGQIVIAGDLVDIKGTALIDASGAASGGKVEIGGGFQGRAVESPVVRTVSASAPEGAPLPVAKRTAVREGAVIRANAGTVGDGGEIIVWADEATWFYGQLEAKGGLELGDGGFAEVSGKTHLAFDGMVDLTAVAGDRGLLLLDPRDINIVADTGMDPNQNASLTGGISYDEGLATQDFVIEADALVATGADVELQATQDIFFETDVDLTRSGSDPDLALTALAGRNISVGGEINTGTADLILTADADFSADEVGPGSDGVGAITFGAGSSLNGNNVVLNAAEAVVLRDVTGTTSLSVSTVNSMSTGATIDQQSGTTITAGSASFDAGTADIALNEDNDFSGEIAAVGTNAAFTDANDIILGDLDLDGTLSVTSNSGTIIDTAAGSAAGDAINVGGATTLTATSGATTLDETNNDFGGAITINAAGQAVTLVDANDVTIASVSADSLSVEADNAIEAVEAARSTHTSIDPTFVLDSLTLIDTELDGATIYTLQGSGTTSDATETLNVDQFIGDPTDPDSIDSISDLTFQTTVPDAFITLFQIDAPVLDLSLQTNPVAMDGGGVIVGNATTTVQDLTVSAGAISNNLNPGNPNSALIVSGTATLSATNPSDDGSIIFRTSGNNFGTLVATADDYIEINNADSITLENISTTNMSSTDVSINAGGAIDQLAGSSIVATNSVDLISGGAVTLAGIDAGSLNVNASGAITDGSDEISVTGTTTLTAETVIGGETDYFDILLDAADTHDFGGAVSASGQDITLDDRNSLTLGAISTHDIGDPVTDAGDLIVNAGGTISQSGSSIVAAGDAEFVADDSVTLSQSGNDFQSVVDVDTSDDAIVLVDTNGLILGGVDGSSLSVSAGGSIIDDGMSGDGEDVSISGITTLSAGGEVVLDDFDAMDVDDIDDDTGHDFGGAVTVSAGGFDVTLVDINSIDVSEATAASLSVQATNGIAAVETARAGGTLNTPTLTLIDTDAAGGGTYRLRGSGSTSDAAGTLNVALLMAELQNNGDPNLTFEATEADASITIAAITDPTFDSMSETSSGELEIRAAGPVGDIGGLEGFGGGLTISTNSSSENSASIELDTAHSISGPIALDTDADGDGFHSDITLDQAIDDTDLGLINGQNVTISGVSSITQSAPHDIEGTASYSVNGGGTITLDNADNEFSGAVSLNANSDMSMSAGTVEIAGAGDTDGGLILGGVEASSLTVTASSTISDTDSAISVSATGMTTLTAVDADGTDYFDILLDTPDTHEFGTAIFATGEDIVLDSAGSLVLGGITTNNDGDADSASETLAMANPSLSNLDGNDGDLIVYAGGTIEDDSDEISVPGTASLTAVDSGGNFFDILLDEADTHDLGTFAAVGEDIVVFDRTSVDEMGEVRDDNGLILGAITTNYDSLLVPANADTASGALMIPDLLGNDGDLFVETRGPITDTDDQIITVAGLTSLLAEDSGDFFDIDLNEAHAFSESNALNASGEQIRIVSTGSSPTARAGTITANGGENDDTLADDLSQAFLTADPTPDVEFLSINAGDIDLTAFDISSASLNIPVGGTIAIRGVTSVSGAPTTNNTPSHIQYDAAAGSGLTVSGLSITAETLTISTSINPDTSATDGAGNVGASAGGDITLSGVNSAVGNLRLISGGDIVQTGGSVSVTGTTYLLAADSTVGNVDTSDPMNPMDQSISLDGAGNNFGGTVDAIAAGAITLNDANAIELGLVSAGFGETSVTGVARDLTVTASGAITQTDASREVFIRGGVSAASVDSVAARMEVPDTINLSSTSSTTATSIELDNAANDFGLVNVSTVTAVNVVADSVVITDVDDVILGAIRANNLSVSVGGTITDDDVTGPINDDVIVSGNTTLISGGDMSLVGDIILDDDFHQFGTVTALADSGSASLELDNNAALTLDNIEASTISINAEGAIDQVADSSIVASSTADITATASVELDQANNDFGSTLDVNTRNTDLNDGVDLSPDGIPDPIEIVDRNDLILGGINGSSLTVTAGGTIEDTSAQITVTGATTLTAETVNTVTGVVDDYHDILLDSADTHDFGGAVSVSGEDIVLDDLNGLILGEVTTHTDTMADTQSDALSGTFPSLMDNDGDLVVNAGGTITDTLAGITVSGDTSLTAETVNTATGTVDDYHDILLDNADVHDFVGAVSASGEDIVLGDQDGLTLGAITTHDEGAADTSSDDLRTNEMADPPLLTNLEDNDGDLIVIAGGMISQDDGTSIVASGTTNLRSGTSVDIDVDGSGNVFEDAVNAFGGDIELGAEDGIVLGNIVGSSLTVTAGGTISDVADPMNTMAAISISGDTSLTAEGSDGEFFDILLDRADLHDFDGAVSASGEDIVLGDQDGLTLGAITTHDEGAADTSSDDLRTNDLEDPPRWTNLEGNDGDLIVNAGGTITDTLAGITVSGDTSLTAKTENTATGGVDEYHDILLDNADLHDFDGVVSASGEDIVLGDRDNLALETITTHDEGTMDFASDALSLTGLADNDGDFVVNAGGTITDTADLMNTDAGITVSGDTSLTASTETEDGTDHFDILLDRADLHDFGGAVSALGEDIVLSDTNDLILGAITTTGVDNPDTALPDLPADIASEGLGLTNLEDNDGDLIVDAGDSVSQGSGSSIFVSDVTDINAGGDVRLGTGNNDFRSVVHVDTSGDSIVLADTNAITLGGVDGSSLTVTAGGTITDTSEPISVTGTTSLTASTVTAGETDYFDVLLDSANTHDFDGAISASGEDIVLSDSDDLTLGTIATHNDSIADVQSDSLSATFPSLADNDGDLIVIAGDSVSQGSGSSILVTDVTDIVANDGVGLGAGSNDFQSVVHVDTSGDSIELADINHITLGGIEGSSLDVTAGSGILDDGVSESVNDDVSISGITTLTSGDSIVLDDINHEFNIVTVDAGSGDANFRLVESSALRFGDVSASRVNVTAGGTINQLPDTSIIANGAADFRSTADIELLRPDNDFRARVDAVGQAITLVDANDIRLGTVDADENLTVRALDGDITDAGSAENSAGGINVAGVTSLAASEDIRLDDSANDFDSEDTRSGELARVDASGQDIELTDEDAIILGSISADSLTVNATGNITDTDDQQITVTGETSLDSGRAAFNIDLDNPDLHDFGGALSATGNNITIDDNGNLILGNVDTEGSLTIRANGAIDDTPGATITIGNNGVFDSSDGVQLLIRRVDGTVDVSGSENIVSVVNGNFRLGSTTLTGDSVFDALSGNLVLTEDHSVSGGSLFLIAEDGNVDMSGISLAGVSGPVLSASDTVAILAPNGAIVMPDDIGANSFQIVAGSDSPVLTLTNSELSDALVSTSLVNDVTSAVELQFARDLLITVPTGGSLPANGVLDIDTAGTIQFTMNATSNFAIGQAEFVEQVGSLAFDPLQFIGALNDDQLLLSLGGDFRIIINNGIQTFNVQNTSSVIGSSNIGSGTIISGDVTIEIRRGDLLQFATFGEVDDRQSQNAAIGTVTLINFVPDENSTINGCIIGAITACTPLGTVILNLQFETGQFLGIAFVDPDEDEDDPFTNRGDEEEWE